MNEEDRKHQREIWGSRCPSLLDECDRLCDEIVRLRGCVRNLAFSLSGFSPEPAKVYERLLEEARIA